MKTLNVRYSSKLGIVSLTYLSNILLQIETKTPWSFYPAAGLTQNKPILMYHKRVSLWSCASVVQKWSFLEMFFFANIFNTLRD